MQAYHITFTDMDLALILIVDGDEQQIYSGGSWSMGEVAKMLTCPVVTLTSETISNPHFEGDEDDFPRTLRRWIRENDGETLSDSLFRIATAPA